MITTNQPLNAVLKNKEYRTFVGCNSSFTVTRDQDSILELKKNVMELKQKILKWLVMVP
jgi:hypothetical protein